MLVLLTLFTRPLSDFRSASQVSLWKPAPSLSCGPGATVTAKHKQVD